MSFPGLDIKARLDALGTLGSIRVGDMPASPDIMGAIFEYGGQEAEGRFGIVGIGYEKSSIQIMFRGIPNDYAGPMAKCRIAWANLAAVQPGTITGGSSNYLTIVPKQSPFSLGKDLNLRFEIVCNFDIKKEP